jgi:hypothetical protein
VQLTAKAPKAVITKEFKDQTSTQEHVPFASVKVPANPAVVTVNMGVTRNLGNYESVKFGVELSLPCDPANIEAAFEEAKGWVDSRVELINQEISEQLKG